MPVFTIQGPQGEEYEIEAPEGATKEQAFEFFKREHSAGRVKAKTKSKLLENPLTGAAETALSMVTGGLAQPIAGLAGLAAGGSAETVEDVMEALTYKPRGETGKKYTQKTGEFLSLPIEYAGKGAYAATGSEAARSIAEAGTEIGLNFLPLGAAGKALKRKRKVDTPTKDLNAVAADLEPTKPMPEAKTAPISVFEQAALAEAQKRQRNAEQAASLEAAIARNQREGERTAYDLGQSDQTLYAGKEGIYTPDNMLVEEALRKQDFERTKSEAADVILAEREAAMQQEMQRRVALEQQAAMRARQEQATTGYADWEANRNVEDAARSAEQLRRLNEQLPEGGYRAQQSIVEDFGNNDPMARMSNMRIDENGIPIRTDISMEAQNLQNPLQMNLWGDELGPALDQTRSLTEAIDSMPSGPERDRAISMLSQDVLADFNLPRTPESGSGNASLSTAPTFGPRMGPRSQQGHQTILNDIAGAAIDAFRKIRSLTLRSPEVVEAKKQLEADAKKQRVQAIVTGKDSGYLENVTTPEAVIAAAERAKDLTKPQAIGGKTVSPGINHLAVKTNNPLVKFMRAKTREVFVEADRLTEQFITGQEGIGKLIQELSPTERVEVVQLLQLGDKKQTRITRDVMAKHGFSEKQMSFVEKFYEMDQFKLETWNNKRAEAGMPAVVAREGHVPGIFKGDYKQLVLSPDGKPLGVIAVDFKWQLEAARKSMLEKFPDAKFSPIRRSSLGGSSGRSGEFGAMQELLTMLAEKDPAFKEVQAMINSAITDNADKAYGAAQHALQKKGIVGNEGNKPWLTPERNAEDFIKAYLQHWEDQMISHLALPVEMNVRALMQNPALDKMDNAKSYVDSYLKNMTGRSTGQVGQALNTLIDIPARLSGIGPNGTRTVVQEFNKRMGQHSMGFGNLLFSVTQWLQLAQTGMPELTAAAKQLGINQAKVVPAMTRAMIDMVSNVVKDPSPELKATLDEAKARGLMTFSEFTDVSKITQGKKSAMFDKIADYNRAELGEKPTRPLMFRAAVLLLRDSGLEGKALYDAAYNVTQAGMFDYRMNERPMMYQRMGVAGQLAGGLQTFKHAYLGQLNRFGANGLKDPVTATLSLTALIGYAGIMGLPFYQELDQLFQAITAKAGKRYTISEYAMEELPRWLKHGIISDVTNVNMQGRLSSADVLPNSPIEAVSPWFSAAGRIADAASDVASFNDKLAWSNLGTQLAPQGPLKGLTENALMSDDEGYVLNREGLRGNVRTEWDKGVRKYTGGRSLNEAITGENQYNSGQRLRAFRDTQKSVMEKVKREYIQNTLTGEKLREYADKYIQSQGDISRFVRELEAFATQADMDKQQRLQGIPGESIGSIYRFQEYQDDVEK